MNIYINIIYGNELIGPAGDGVYIDIFNDDSCIVVNINNNDFDNTQTTGFSILNATPNIDFNLNNFDPLFVNAVANDYHLDAASLLIDTCDNAAPGVLTNDLDNFCRLDGLFVYMRAYES